MIVELRGDVLESHGPLEQLSRAHMGSQRLKRHCSAQSLLHICYDCYLGVLVGILVVVTGISLTLLPSLGPFSSYFTALSSLIMRAFALSYCILLCPVRLSSLGGLFFSGEKMEVTWIWGKGKVVGSWEEYK